jgi:hydroxymethylpyrimidine pyrophosphatase-like HAD family hydrolase
VNLLFTAIFSPLRILTVTAPAGATTRQVLTLLRVVYTDIDGTMVGPHGSFFHGPDGAPSLAPANVLDRLHRERVALVLVSGRKSIELIEAMRIFGADGFIAELGGESVWDRGRASTRNWGATPAGSASPTARMTEARLAERLFAQFPGRLEFHAPWHLGHDVDLMLRGDVSTSEVDGLLESWGFGWLRLRDNGILPMTTSETLSPDALPPHVYHLMPDGIDKGQAVADDLARRELAATDAIAIGDSVADLAMAGSVGTMWVTGNGGENPDVRRSAEPLRNVRFADGHLGHGWAEAIAQALQESDQAAGS